MKITVIPSWYPNPKMRTQGLFLETKLEHFQKSMKLMFYIAIEEKDFIQIYIPMMALKLLLGI